MGKKSSKSGDATNTASASQRLGTGVEGLDQILEGGLPENRIYLLEGDPGTGKTTIALQFLLEGARRGEAGLYVTLSETKEELQAVAESHGWSLDGFHIYELVPLEESLKPESQYTIFHPSEVELGETTSAVLKEVERIQPRRVVFDSLSEMRLLAGEALRFRRQILALKQYFPAPKSTVPLFDEQGLPGARARWSSARRVPANQLSRRSSPPALPRGVNTPPSTSSTKYARPTSPARQASAQTCVVTWSRVSSTSNR